MTAFVRRASILAAISLALSAGCSQEEWDRLWAGSNKGSQPTADPRTRPTGLAWDGTIGAIAAVDGLRLQQVRGYGLVVNLGDTGGRDGPEMVKKHLIKEMQRRQGVGEPGPDPKDLLDSKDTAMVEATGFIPAGAAKGARFDILLKALGTQTKSIVGGRVVLCDLTLFADSPSGVISGEVVAFAAGPIFVSPFGRERDSATRVDPRVGVVLGGGIVKKPRNVRLVLNTPSYGIAARVRDRLNARYGTVDTVADAVTPSYIDLKVPHEFRARQPWFLQLVVHTAINGEEGYLEKRAHDLVKEIARPDALCDDIGLAWEAIGRPALQAIQPLYAHASPSVRYFAGRTGLRMGDNDGLEAVAAHALDPQSPHREAAIEELGHATRMHRAGECLARLVDDSDNLIRIKAYKALRNHLHPIISTEVLDQDNLILDVVDCKGPPMVFVQRSEAPLIAVFGKGLKCRAPLMYPNGRRSGWVPTVQISAGPGAEALTMMRRLNSQGKISPELRAPLDLAALIRYLGGRPTLDPEGKVAGLAVPYSEVIDVLNSLCSDKAIAATFILERVTASGDLAPARPRERKESDF